MLISLERGLRRHRSGPSASPSILTSVEMTDSVDRLPRAGASAAAARRHRVALEDQLVADALADAARDRRDIELRQAAPAGRAPDGVVP